jgi:hypothetical protein
VGQRLGDALVDVGVGGIDGKDGAKFRQGSRPISDRCRVHATLIANGKRFGCGGRRKEGSGLGAGVDGSRLGDARSIGADSCGRGGRGGDRRGKRSGSRLCGQFSALLLAADQEKSSARQKDCQDTGGNDCQDDPALFAARIAGVYRTCARRLRGGTARGRRRAARRCRLHQTAAAQN